jgi:hypothetical protein
VYANLQCRWLIARLGDAPDNCQVLLDALWTSLFKNRSESNWAVLDREGLVALEYVSLSAALTLRTLASSEQLDSFLARRPGQESSWLLSSAEVMELPRLLSE